MDAAKIHPPSDARIAEARRSGMTPRTLVCAFAASVVAFAMTLQARGPALWAALGELLSAPLEALARGDDTLARTDAIAAVWAVARELFVLFCAVSLLVAGTLWLVQGPSFGLTLGAPKRFDEPKRSFTGVVLAVLSVLALAALSVVPMLWLEGGSLHASLWRILWLTLLLLVLSAVVDAALARAAFFRALWLSRRQHQDDLREAYGAPEVREARSRRQKEQT